jgi:hypothetical protein
VLESSSIRVYSGISGGIIYLIGLNKSVRDLGLFADTGQY